MSPSPGDTFSHAAFNNWQQQEMRPTRYADILKLCCICDECPNYRRAVGDADNQEPSARPRPGNRLRSLRPARTETPPRGVHHRLDHPRRNVSSERSRGGQPDGRNAAHSGRYRASVLCPPSQPVTGGSRHRAVRDAATAQVMVTADQDPGRAAKVTAVLIKRCRTVLTERCRYITR